MSIVDPAIETYARSCTSSEPALLQELWEETHSTMEFPQMLTGQLEGRFLKLVVQITGATRIIEIGTFTGYSALSMAEGLPEDGIIHTCEINPNAQQIAEKYFGRSHHGKKITIHKGAALETLRTLPGPYDLGFIDADKQNYPNYFNALLPKIRSGGVMLFDNALWSGKVLDPKDEDSRAIDELNRRVQDCDTVDNVMLTVRDGIQFVRKR